MNYEISFIMFSFLFCCLSVTKVKHTDSKKDFIKRQSTSAHCKEQKMAPWGQKSERRLATTSPDDYDAN